MRILLRVIKEARKFKGLFVISIISTLLLAVLNLIAPRLMSHMITLVSQGLDSAGLQQTLMIAVILLCLYLSRILFRYLSNFLAHKAAWTLVKDLRVILYGKLQSLSIGYYRDHESGDLVSRTMNDTATFELLYAHLLPESITNVITVAGVTIILLTINPRLALITCLPIPFILLSG